MENQPTPIWKHALMYGLYTGAALIVLSLIWYVLDMYMKNWTAWFSYAVLLAGVVLASMHYRDKYNNGLISYGQSVSAGFLTALFAGVVAGIYTFIFMSFVGEEFARTMLAITEEKTLASNPEISDEQLEMILDWTSRMFKPGWLTMMSLIANAGLGLIFALIASIFIKKEEKAI
jgi:hypothetical protein